MKPHTISGRIARTPLPGSGLKRPGERQIDRHELGTDLAFMLLFGTRGLWDVNGKPKGLTRAAYEALELKSDDWFIDAEIVLSERRRGLAVAELPVVFHRNDERASFVRAAAILEFVRNMGRQRFPRRS